MQRNKKARIASGLNVLFGIWMAISPFILGHSSSTAAKNEFVVGVIIFLCALIRVVTPEILSGLSFINSIMGIWLIFSPYVLNYDQFSPVVNSMTIGAIVFICSVWSISATPLKVDNDNMNF